MSKSVLMVTEVKVLRVDLLPGSTIETVEEQMLELAKRLQCRVWADFNGIDLLARPDGKKNDIIQQWELRRK